MPIKRGIVASLGGDCVSPPIGQALASDALEGNVSALAIVHLAGVVAENHAFDQQRAWAVHLSNLGKKQTEQNFMTDTPQTQVDKFKQAARELETDDEPKRFAERLGKLVKHKPVPEKPE